MTKTLLVLSYAVCSAFNASPLLAQTVTLRYGQIPSSIKTVSAVQFVIGQRKGLFTREGINLDMRPIEGGADNMMVALTTARWTSPAPPLPT